MGPEESLDLNNVIENSLDALVQNESEDIPYPEKHSVSLFECRADVSGGDGKVHDQSTSSIYGTTLPCSGVSSSSALRSGAAKVLLSDCSASTTSPS